MELSKIIESVLSYHAAHVTVTGGEPLAQPDCLSLLTLLCDQGLNVSLETSGAMSIEGVDSRATTILDLKPPASGEEAKNDWNNISLLKPQDQVKFVVGNRADYDWSKSKIIQYGLENRVKELLFSPVQGQQNPTQLAEWILSDRLPVRLQLQLHKLLWNDEPGH